MINKLTKLAVTATLLMTPIMFTGCSDDNNNVGRDKNVPNNIEDNYSGDADNNRTSEGNKTNENEEEANNNMKMNSTTTGVRSSGLSTGIDYSSSVANSGIMNNNDKAMLEARISKLEKEIMDLKTAKKGNDIVGQK